MIRGREVWSEVEPFMLLGRTGTARPEAVPFAAAAAVLAVPMSVRPAESRPSLELVAGQGVAEDVRSSADLVLLRRENQP